MPKSVLRYVVDKVKLRKLRLRRKRAEGECNKFGFACVGRERGIILKRSGL